VIAQVGEVDKLAVEDGGIVGGRMIAKGAVVLQ
jgi:hypothetical protein